MTLTRALEDGQRVFHGLVGAGRLLADLLEAPSPRR